jgi:hypothetical protein
MHAYASAVGGGKRRTALAISSTHQAKMSDRMPGYAPIDLVGLNRADELDIVIDHDSVLTIKLATCSYTSRGVLTF